MITEIGLRLHGIPEAASAAICQFDKLSDAVESVIAIMQAGIPVARIELLDDVQMAACIAYSKLEGLRAAATLFFVFHGTPAAVDRNGFIDLMRLKETDPVAYGKKIDELTAAAAAADDADEDVARLNLARLYLANRYGFEALGVLDVLDRDLKRPDLKRDAEEMKAAADVISYRPADALAILGSPAFASDIDARMWRSIAEADSGD